MQLKPAKGTRAFRARSFALPLLLLGVFGHSSIALAQSSAAVTATGSMTAARQFHTATLLPTGKVLVTGGEITSSPLGVWASTELYDPPTETFTASGDMNTPRYMHTATLLPNGKVLIAGGRSGQTFNPALGNCENADLCSAELYDPVTGIFTRTGSMATARSAHTATLLNNGKVLLAGGVNSNAALFSAELYDPSSGTFTATGDMTEPGADTATLLPDGKVLITRTVTYGFSTLHHAELYDPATGTFIRTSDMTDPNAGAGPSATLLTNGKVLIAGGALGDFGSTSAEIYDPAMGVFTITGNLPMRVYSWQAAALLPEGQVLVAGDGGGVGGAVQLYNPVTGRFSLAGDTQSLEGHRATLLPNGTVLLSGGWVFCGVPPFVGCIGTIASAQVYHPEVLVPAPQLFSVSGDGKGQGAIWHATSGEIASPRSPAFAGETVSMYTTSLAGDGMIPPQVAIGGRLAQVVYFGVAPGYPGYNQVNVLMPSGVAAGAAVSVRLMYLSRPSNEVTIGVQ